MKTNFSNNVGKITLKEVRLVYEEFSGIVSKACRINCIMGLVMIGLLCIGRTQPLVNAGRLSLYLFLFSLFVDLLQGVIQTSIYYRMYLKNQENLKCFDEEHIELSIKERINLIPWIAFYAKTLFCIIGYIYFIIAIGHLI